MVNKAWKQTTRAFSKRLFLDGTVVRVCPCKTDPDIFWEMIFPFCEIDPYMSETFEKQCKYLMKHYCNTENGETLSYYYNTETM